MYKDDGVVIKPMHSAINAVGLGLLLLVIKTYNNSLLYKNSLQCDNSELLKNGSTISKWVFERKWWYFPLRMQY